MSLVQLIVSAEVAHGPWYSHRTRSLDMCDSNMGVLAVQLDIGSFLHPVVTVETRISTLSVFRSYHTSAATKIMEVGVLVTLVSDAREQRGLQERVRKELLYVYICHLCSPQSARNVFIIVVCLRNKQRPCFCTLLMTL